MGYVWSCTLCGRCIQSGQVMDDTERLIPCHLDSGVIMLWCDGAVVWSCSTSTADACMFAYLWQRTLALQRHQWPDHFEYTLTTKHIDHTLTILSPLKYWPACKVSCKGIGTVHYCENNMNCFITLSADNQSQPEATHPSKQIRKGCVLYK